MPAEDDGEAKPEFAKCVSLQKINRADDEGQDWACMGIGMWKQEVCGWCWYFYANQGIFATQTSLVYLYIDRLLACLDIDRLLACLLKHR